MTNKGLKDRDLTTLRAWVRNHMSRKATAKELYISLSGLDYRLASIRDRTGLDPHHFLDLIQLRAIAQEMWPGQMGLYPGDRELDPRDIVPHPVNNTNERG